MNQQYSYFVENRAVQYCKNQIEQTMILITGATGGFGTETIEFLLNRGISPRNIAALIRSEDKASHLRNWDIDIRKGNYDDYDSLVKAFRGVDKLLFISGNDLQKRDKQHENIIMAAVEAVIKHVIYTSFERKNDDTDIPAAFVSRTHIETEKKILSSGIPYTFLRNALYAEGLPMFLGGEILEKGVFIPAGNGRVPFASRKDMAEAAANILAGGNEHLNKSYKTVNIKNYSFYDIAAMLSDLSGKRLAYVSPDPEEYTRNALQSGIPKEAVAFLLGWFQAIRDGYFESDHSDMELLIGRKPADLKEILAKMYAKEKQAI